MNTVAIHFRRAAREDIPALVRLLADDPLGAQPEAFTSDKARPDAIRFYEGLASSRPTRA